MMGLIECYWMCYRVLGFIGWLLDDEVGRGIYRVLRIVGWLTGVCGLMEGFLAIWGFAEIGWV